MTTISIAQARIGSTRLPGKVMMPLGGRPVLAWVVTALRAVPSIDTVVIATSTLEADNVISEWCFSNGVACFRGSESDVLDRFYQCAKFFKADVVLRLTCDCALLDPNVVGQVIQLREMTGADYCSNQDTYPDGLDTECFTFRALESAWKEATRTTDRDTVTQWIIRNRHRFPAEYLICPFPGMNNERWVLDTQKDYEFCQAVAARWTRKTPPSCVDILRILDKEPALREINRGAIRNERFYEGLAQESRQEPRFEQSNALLARATKTIPGGSQTFSKSHLFYPAGAAPLYVTHGDGARVFDVDGNDYVDLVNALLPVILGYRDPDVDYAVRRQMTAGMSFSLATELEIELAEKLQSLIPCAEMTRFGKSGTDVTTAAVRLARAYTGKDHILVGGYHGWADWSMGVSEHRAGIPNALGSCLSHKAKTPKEIEWLNTCLPNQIAAIVVEPMEDKPYLEWLRQFCTKHGILLIFDEIITGFRYDMGGAQKLFGVTPDLACFGKSMGNGMPISALCGRGDIMKHIGPPGIFYSGTFFGDTLSLAAALATIKKMEEKNVIEHLKTYSKVVAAHIHNCPYMPFVLTVHEYQNYPKLTFHDHPNGTAQEIQALFTQEMARMGVLILNANGISFAHKIPEFERIKKAYTHTIGTIFDSLSKQGELQKRLKGTVSVTPLRAA